MAENLMKVPAKGILKNSTSFEGSTTNKGTSNRGTKWDEMNILATHHPPDKDYGHMKIEEPKTPYSYQGEDSGDEGEKCDLDSKILNERLMADAEKFSNERSETPYTDEDDEEEEEDPEDKAKRRTFENKRKAHYNEFMAVKLARQLMKKDEDLESSDDENCSGKDSSAKIEEDIEGMDTVEYVESSSK